MDIRVETKGFELSDVDDEAVRDQLVSAPRAPRMDRIPPVRETCYRQLRMFATRKRT